MPKADLTASMKFALVLFAFIYDVFMGKRSMKPVKLLAGKRCSDPVYAGKRWRELINRKSESHFKVKLEFVYSCRRRATRAVHLSVWLKQRLSCSKMSWLVINSSPFLLRAEYALRSISITLYFTTLLEFILADSLRDLAVQLASAFLCLYFSWYCVNSSYIVMIYYICRWFINQAESHSRQWWLVCRRR